MSLFKLSMGLVALVNLFLPFSSLALTTSSLTNQNNNQYYSVVFDKENEATIIAKLTFTNITTKPIKNIRLEIPGVDTRIVSLIQEQNQERKCLIYRNQIDPTLPQTDSTCTNYSPTEIYALIIRDETKDEKTANSLKVDLPLKQEIASGDYTSLILYYKTQGLTSKTWNGNKYTFETIKSSYDIDNVRVAVNVTDDIYLRNTTKATTNYEESIVRGKVNLNTTFSTSPALESLSQNIISSSGVVEETSSLDPNENFKVEGKYFPSSYMAELPGIIGVGLILLILGALLIIIIRSEKK